MSFRTGQRMCQAIVAAVIVGGCGSSSAPAPVSGPPVSSNTITITSAGVSPKNVQVSVGSRVLFMNNDTRSHNMTSDPHPSHDDCLELNQVGFLSPGQSRETGNLVTARTCGFHDHDDFSQQNLQGSIVIR
jgi:plastocyanin